MYQGMPSLTVDGEAVPDLYLEDDWRVHTEWEAVTNGYEPGWLNSAAISYADDEVTVSISLGDPRGAFTMTARRLEDGSVILHVPHAEDTTPHVELTPLHPGTFQVYGPGTKVEDEDEDE